MLCGILFNALSSTIAQERERIREAVEKMRKSQSVRIGSDNIQEVFGATGYNEAIDDVLSLLTNPTKE